MVPETELKTTELSFCDTCLLFGKLGSFLISPDVSFLLGEHRYLVKMINLLSYHDDTIIYTLSLQGTYHASGTVLTCEVGTSAGPIFQGRKLKFKEGL